MDFSYSLEAESARAQLTAFMDEHVVPNVAIWEREIAAGVYPPSLLERLKGEARAAGLWNLFLPDLPPGAPGRGMSVLDFAPLAEVMGRVFWAPEVFNCSAPDTGNMEL